MFYEAWPASVRNKQQKQLGWRFEIFLYVHPHFGKWSESNLTSIFQLNLPTRKSWDTFGIWAELSNLFREDLILHILETNQESQGIFASIWDVGMISDNVSFQILILCFYFNML